MKQTHRCRELTSGYQWGKGRGKGHDMGRELRDTKHYVKINKLQGQGI